MIVDRHHLHSQSMIASTSAYDFAKGNCLGRRKMIECVHEIQDLSKRIVVRQIEGTYNSVAI
jgi:hypothetical protein